MQSIIPPGEQRIMNNLMFKKVMQPATALPLTPKGENPARTADLKSPSGDLGVITTTIYPVK